MNGQAMRWARAQMIESMPLKAMLGVLASRCDATGSTTVSQATIAVDMALSVRQVKRHLAILDALGMIRREVRSRGARGRATDRITLTLTKTFSVSKIDIAEAASASVRKVTFREVARGHPPHLAQGDTGVTPIRDSSSKASAKPKSSWSNQGESSPPAGAEQGDVSAPIDSVPPTSDLPPPGSKTSRRSKGSVYARHRSLLDHVRRGTVH